MQECSQQLADAIKKARLELGLTQEQVAEKSGTDVRTIINMEQGRGNPKLETLFPLIHALKMDAREIFDVTAKLDAPQFVTCAYLLMSAAKKKQPHCFL